MKTDRMMHGLALGMALALAASGCGDHGGADAEPNGEASIVLGPSDVATAAVANLTEGVSVSGTLVPTADARLTAPIPDVVEQVLVKEGQRVRRGQVLARMRAEALGPVAASAEAQRRVAEADLTRMRNLEQAGAVSRREVDSAEAAFKAAEAASAQAAQRLDDATVRAPFDGVVAERSVRSGDRVGDGDPLFRVVNTSELEFEATVTAEHAAALEPGLAVDLTVTGLADRALQGRIARVNATADPATRQVRVYVSVPNRDGRLVGDLFASGRVVLRQADHALAVPAPAVRAGAQGGHEVWLVSGGKLEARAVHPGLRDEALNLVQVDALQAGDTVLVASAEGLRAGQAVQIAGRRE